MADNAQVFLDRRTKVLNQITLYPETHDQSTFETTEDECGTTRCVAGWAIIQAAPEAAHLDQARRLVGVRLGLGQHASHIAIAGRLLGLTYEEAYELFYTAADAEDATLLLRQYAAGLDHIVHLNDFNDLGDDYPPFNE